MSTTTPTSELITETAQAVEATGGLGMLGINLKIFIAQLFNFVLVLLVMWKWVYQPLVKLLDARAERIAESLHNAEAIEKRMEGIKQEQDRLIAQAKNEAAVLLEQARDSAHKQKKDLLENAKQEVRQVISQGKDQLKAEKSQMVREAKEELIELAIVATRKIIKEQMDEKQSRKIAEQAIDSV